MQEEDYKILFELERIKSNISLENLISINELLEQHLTDEDEDQESDSTNGS